VVIETHTHSEHVVALHQREPYNIDWESIFLTTHDADTDSIVFVKRILFITLSQILYFRKLLPPNSFQHYHLEGTDFTFTSVSPIDDAGFIAIEALSGTFDAMDRKYLRSFVVPVLDMSKGDGNTKFVHESYRINFSYANDGTPHIVYSSREGEEEIRCFTIQDDLKKAGLDFLTRVSGHIAALPPLPENCRPIYQLAYYDRRTPPDYEPLGFHADNMLHIVQKTCSLDHSYISDSVTTKFHGYSLSVRLRDMAAKELDDTIVAQSQETVDENDGGWNGDETDTKRLNEGGWNGDETDTKRLNDGGWNGDETDETLFKSEASSEADSSEDFFADTS